MLTKFTSQVTRKLAVVSSRRHLSGFPAPRLFDYETIIKNLSVSDAIDAVEQAFSALAKGKVDVPMPMHIGIEESASAGPGDCHIKGGYVSSEKTFTVKLACVSFYKNVEKGLPPVRIDRICLFRRGRQQWQLVSRLYYPLLYRDIVHFFLHPCPHPYCVTGVGYLHCCRRCNRCTPRDFSRKSIYD